jgi:membrane protein DedA with SNARE-associated domain
VPQRAFRDSAIFYAVLACAVVGFGVLTDNDLTQTIIIAVAFFVIATGYSWWRFRQRLTREEDSS